MRRPSLPGGCWRAPMPDIVEPARIHVVGAGGAGMGPIAKLLAAMGHYVTGSDLRSGDELTGLGRHGIETWVGGRPGRMAACDLVVASSAVPDGDAELTAASAAGVTVWRRPRLLRAITGRMPTVGFTGTHGKTTSTALAVVAARSLDLDPSFIVGAEMVGAVPNAHLGGDDLLLLEADEAFGTFARLEFTALMVTNVDSDHLDHYQTLETLERTFAEVVDGVDGPVVIGVDDPGGRRLASRTGRPGYGMAADAEWRIVDVEAGPSEVRFRLDGRFPPAQVLVGGPGLHTARNACGVLALLAELGYDPVRAAAGMEGFGGVRRRLEKRGVVGGVTIIDSYAHHPAEVAADLEAIRPVERQDLWVVFQPHLYSRTAALAEEFGHALASADRLVVTDVYGAREAPAPGVSGELVADAARRLGASVRYVPGLDDVSALVADRVEPGDLVVTLGAGDITSVSHDLVRRLGHRS